jgi:hypothetical protein
MPIDVTYGYSSVSKGFNTGNKNYAVDTATSLGNLITAVRVKDIVLDKTHPQFTTVGEWNGLGTIFFDVVKDPNFSNKNTWSTARPISSNIKVYPLINEIVYLISFPDTGIGNNPTSGQLYYISTVGIWNTPHQNGYPTIDTIPPSSQQKTYTMTELGSLRTVTSQSTKLELGNTFIERGNIHPLLPFEGDVIEEGRWGNSIRFGSTIKTKSPEIIGLNNWSQGPSTSGDPITIIRNGQSIKANNEGWVPITEDINNDLSSIYLTSTQTIPLNASSISYFSYPSNPPQDVNKFNGPQLIYNSGRIVLNTNQDHLLLSSIKSVNLNAVESVNIDTPTTIIQSSKVLLGSKNATEPVLLGDSTIATLNNLINNLNGFLQVCSTVVSTAPGTPIVPLNLSSNQLLTQLKIIQGNLEKLKSNTVKTV